MVACGRISAADALRLFESKDLNALGASSPQLRRREHATKSVLQTEAEMVKAIREAGRTPVQRNTFYEPVKVLADGHRS